MSVGQVLATRSSLMFTFACYILRAPICCALLFDASPLNTALFSDYVFIHRLFTVHAHR